MFNRGDMMAIKMIFRDNMENYLNKDKRETSKC